MKKYKYPEQLRKADFNWLNEWLESNLAVDSKHMGATLKSIIQYEMEFSVEDIDDWLESVNKQSDDLIDSARMIKNLAEQVKNKFEEI